jgi:hypothetical protein
MLRKHFNRALTVCAIASLWLVSAPTPASAGCGCDHPPPAWALVMPAFGSPGKTIVVDASGAGFKKGRNYDVTLKPASGQITVQGEALDASRLEVTLPSGLAVGPTTITVNGPQGFSLTHPASLFTTLPAPPVVPAGGGALSALQVQAAVSSDGTLILPLNMRHVLDGMQVAFQFDDLPYEFDPDDVVIYNSDGVDLTLFTLAVDGQTEMQWGSYYGWEVEDDTGLFGIVYDTKVNRSSDPGKTSDVLTYWRHEFQTYVDAHVSGGTHVLDTNGVHPDGSVHINHGHLIIAINGVKRSANDPDDPAMTRPLMPGKVMVDIHFLATPTEAPIEPEVVLTDLEATTSWGSFDPAESHFDEFEGMDN